MPESLGENTLCADGRPVAAVDVLTEPACIFEVDGSPCVMCAYDVVFVRESGAGGHGGYIISERFHRF